MTSMKMKMKSSTCRMIHLQLSCHFGLERHGIVPGTPMERDLTFERFWNICQSWHKFCGKRTTTTITPMVKDIWINPLRVGSKRFCMHCAFCDTCPFPTVARIHMFLYCMFFTCLQN